MGWDFPSNFDTNQSRGPTMIGVRGSTTGMNEEKKKKRRILSSSFVAFIFFCIRFGNNILSIGKSLIFH